MTSHRRIIWFHRKPLTTKRKQPAVDRRKGLQAARRETLSPATRSTRALALGFDYQPRDFHFRVTQ